MNNQITVVLAIGGRGTRFSEISGAVPKPLFKINGTSTLERTLIELSLNGLSEIILTTCYKSEVFREFIKNIKKKINLNITIFEENYPMGECGALWHIKNKLLENTLFINGDLIFSINFKKLIAFHKRLDSEITLVTHPSSHPEDSDLIISPNGTNVEKLFFKRDYYKDDSSYPILGFSGISIFKTSTIDDLKRPLKEENPNLFGYFVKELFKINKKIFSYNTSEYIKDMGTVDRFKTVTEDLKNGLVERKNYINHQKALFLDRDNTLIDCKAGSYILSCKDVIFLDKHIEKIQKIAGDFSIIVIVTNQPQISMNKLSLNELDSINNLILRYCRRKNLIIDLVMFCPHHPHIGFENEIKILKGDCFCRKPNPGMLLECAFQRNINLKESLFIGDSLSDKFTAMNAGCQFLNVIDL